MSASTWVTSTVVAAAAATAFAGCGTGSADESPTRTRTSAVQLPTRFAAVAAAPATVTLNVHVPDEGSIPGTDLSIPYDKLTAQRRELPDRDTTIAVYCRTGRMSTIARRTLQRMGYRRVVELRGGMVAWRAAGRRLVPPAREPGAGEAAPHRKSAHRGRGAPPASAADAGPSIEILRPLSAAKVRSDAVDVSVAVRDFEVVEQRVRPPFPPPVPGKGHVHFYLDTQRLPRVHGPPATGAYRSTSTTTYTWTGVAPGRHSLAVQLVGRDHAPLSPPASDRITVDVQ